MGENLEALRSPETSMEKIWKALVSKELHSENLNGEKLSM